MAATAAQIAQLRRMVGESDILDPYTDGVLTTYIESYPVMDERGEAPYTWDTSTEPPTQDENDNWIDTYDLHAAAADVWEEKAATVSVDFDFSADGGKYTRSQVYGQYMAAARMHKARRYSKTATLIKWPKEGGAVDATPWIINNPEPSDD